MPRLLPTPASGRRPSRGAALLLVITCIAVVTALTVDLAYNTRVSAQLAANARDDLQATYLARSAVNMARLVLHFQQSLDQASQGLGSVRPGAGAAGAASLSVRLWELVPVSSTALGFLGGVAAQSAVEQAFPTFGGFAGSFEAKVEDEDRKINLRQLDATARNAFAQATRLVELMREPKWDFLFDRDDANGIRVTRPELLSAVRDWVDANETGSLFTGSPARPFDDGFGDENGVYDRLLDRYKAKNAAFDSMDELYMVAGVSDAFMAAFGDRLTVYPDLNATINVNTDDPRELLLDAVAMGGGTLQAPFLDPNFLEKLQAALKLARPLPFLALSPQQFAAVLQGLGVQVDPSVLSASNVGVSSPYGGTSTTFRIRATGSSGGVERHLEAVVIFDPRRSLGLQLDLGRLIHWHEE